MNMKILKTLMLFGAFASLAGFAQDQATSGDSSGIGSSQSVVDDCNPSENKDDLFKLAQRMEISSCYDQRKTTSTGENSKEGESQSRSLGLDLLKADFEICNCLRDKANSIQAYGTLFSKAPEGPALSDTAQMLTNFEERATWITDKIKERRVSLAFQASILFDGNPEMSFGYRNGVVDKLIGTRRSNLEHATKEMDIPKPLADGVKKILERLDTPALAQEGLFSERPFQEGQCVGAREFLAFRQLPSGEVIQDLIRNPNFDEKSWNIEELKKSLRDLQSIEEETPALQVKIDSISGKIKFLNRNPMIRTLMGANTEIPDSATPAIKLEIEKKSKFKRELFEILKKSAGTERCLTAFHCRESAFKNNKSVEYKRRLQAFFSRGEVAETTKKEAEIEISQDLERLKHPDNFLPWKVDLSQKAVLEEFVQKNPGMNPENCTGSNNENIAGCAKIYAAFCQNLDHIKSRVENRRSEDPNTIKTDEDLDSKNDFNPDFATNKAFQDFNKGICQTRKNVNSHIKRPPQSFFDFKDTYCQLNAERPECNSNTSANIRLLREKYLDLHDSTNLFNHIVKRDPVEDVSAEGIKKITSTNNNKATVDFDEVRRQNHFDDNNSEFFKVSSTNSSAAIVPEKAVPFASIAQGLNNLSSAMGGGTEAEVDTQMNYSNVNLGGAQASGQGAEPQKVESMAQTEREEMLEDWKKEMAEWKEKKNSADPVQASVASSKESAMMAQIEALQQLVAQQKKLSDEQLKLINDSVAARNVERSIASVEDDEEKSSKPNRKKSSNGIVSSSPDVDEEVQRSMSNVQDQQLNTGGNGGGQAFSRLKSSSSNALSDSSKDSVAREEAKLVYVRENTNGSITIASSTNGGGLSSANAIVVQVSDALYLSAQSNPTGLNLTQLEQSIPKDQIAKLQDKGDYFILLLQNGKNQPLEVKVKKVNNKLVQVDGAPIVSRRVWLEGLRNNLPTVR